MCICIHLFLSTSVSILSLGIPAEPSFGELSAGPDPGQVTFQIKTIASGLSTREARGFEFVLIPVLDGTPGNELRYPRPDYQSGRFETITISGLTPGQSYTFSATAVNFFGISAAANSAPIHAGTQKKQIIAVKHNY